MFLYNNINLKNNKIMQTIIKYNWQYIHNVVNWKYIKEKIKISKTTSINIRYAKIFTFFDTNAILDLKYDTYENNSKDK